MGGVRAMIVLAAKQDPSGGQGTFEAEVWLTAAWSYPLLASTFDADVWLTAAWTNPLLVLLYRAAQRMATIGCKISLTARRLLVN